MAKVDYEAIRLEKAKQMKHPDWHRYSGWPPAAETTPTGEKVIPNRRKKQQVAEADEDNGEQG